MKVVSGLSTPAILRRAGDPGPTPAEAAPMPHATRVMMIPPAHFNIDVAINVHMRDASGRPHRLDRTAVARQWEAVKAAYESIGVAVLVCDPVPGLPDMTFAANQSLPFVDGTGDRRALLSNMADDVRHQEVKAVGAFLERQGYAAAPVTDRTPETLFEGTGDGLWVTGRRFLLGGYGFRTRASMWERVAQATGAPVALFELKNPKFYHLDTCLSVLDEETVLACPDAFTGEGRALLKALFPRILPVPLAEADAPGFACNAHCPDGTHVLIQAGCTTTNQLLERAGFKVIPLETGEFIKSGGSVFCLKLALF